MPHPARVMDQCAHPTPNFLAPGPGSSNIMIGFMPAWRAMPAEMDQAVVNLSRTVERILAAPNLNPAAAAGEIAALKQDMTNLGGATGPKVAAAAGSAGGAFDTTNAALSATWTSASAAPGGQPAADLAYTQGVQAAAAAAATAVFSSMSGGGPDMHLCSTPSPPIPHGPGFAVYGSPTIVINGLPLAREGDSIAEAAGGMNKITKGYAQVNVDAGPGESNYVTNRWDLLFLGGTGGPSTFLELEDLTRGGQHTCRGKPLYEQERGMSCSQASAKMVIDEKHGRGTVSEEQLRKESAAQGGYHPANGTPGMHIPSMLNQHGVPTDNSAGGVEEVSGPQTIENATAGGKPTILNLKDPGHSVVADGVVERDGKKYVQIRDPAYPGGAGCREIEVGGDEWNERVKGGGTSVIPLK